jgi:hypothetical protein
MEIVTALDFEVSATDVAVMVALCAELVAAGAVYVAPVVEVLESVPGPTRFQETPAEFLSLSTEAERVIASPPSTVVEEAVAVTPIGFEPPPHPATQRDRTKHVVNDRTVTNRRNALHCSPHPIESSSGRTGHCIPTAVRSMHAALATNATTAREVRHDAAKNMQMWKHKGNGGSQC